MWLWGRVNTTIPEMLVHILIRLVWLAPSIIFIFKLKYSRPTDFTLNHLFNDLTTRHWTHFITDNSHPKYSTDSRRPLSSGPSTDFKIVKFLPPGHWLQLSISLSFIFYLDKLLKRHSIFTWLDLPSRKYNRDLIN